MIFELAMVRICSGCSRVAQALEYIEAVRGRVFENNMRFKVYTRMNRIECQLDRRIVTGKDTDGMDVYQRTKEGHLAKKTVWFDPYAQNVAKSSRSSNDRRKIIGSMHRKSRICRQRRSRSKRAASRSC